MGDSMDILQWHLPSSKKLELIKLSQILTTHFSPFYTHQIVSEKEIAATTTCSE